MNAIRRNRLATDKLPEASALDWRRKRPRWGRALGTAGGWLLLCCSTQTPAPSLPGISYSQTAPAESPEDPPSPARVRVVDSRLSMEDLDGRLAGFFDSIGRGWGPGYAPSGLVAVSAAGRTVWSKPLGYAQYEQSRPHSVTAPVLLGPLEHLFTVLVTLKLVDEGALSLDAPVGEYLPTAPATVGQIPLRDFLQHRVGLPRVADALVATTAGKPVADQLNLAWQRPPAPPPGGKRLVSNAQRAVLVAAIERVTGKGFAEVLAQTVATPLKLRQTGVLSEQTTEAVAHRYAASPQDGERQQLVPISAGSLYASSQIYASAADLLQTVEALQGEQLLSPSSLEALHQPIDDSAFQVASWTSRHRGFEVIHWGHEGRSAVATRSALWTVPELDLTIAVLSNNQAFDARLAARAVLEASLGQAVEPLPEKRAVKLDEQLAELVRGAYFLNDEAQAALTAQGISPRAIAAMATASIFRNRDKLFFKPARQGAMRMTPSGPEAFVLSGGKATLTFDFDYENPDETVLLLRQGKVLAEYQRKPARQPKKVEDEPSDSP